MWTETTRRKHERGRRRYASDLTDAEWVLIEPHTCRQSSVWAGGVRPICVVCLMPSCISRGPAVSGGCCRRTFHHFTTVQGYFYDWRDNGLFENINFHLLLSFAVTPPTLARLGTYRMLSAENPPIGFGAGKTEKWWIMGRSQDQFGPEGPEVSTSAHVALRLYGTRQKADGLLEIRT